MSIEKKEEKNKDFIQTLTTRYYQVFHKGFLYEFRFHPEKTLEENIEALEFLLNSAKKIRDDDKELIVEDVE